MKKAWEPLSETSVRDSSVALADWATNKSVSSERPVFPSPQNASFISSSGKHSESPAPESGLGQNQNEPMPSPAAYNNMMAELERLLHLLSTALGNINFIAEQEKVDLSKQAVELGLGLAGELAAGAIKAEPNRLAEIVMEAVNLMEDERKITVRIHPDILTLLADNNLLEPLQANPRVTAVMDSSLNDVGCIVESDNRKIDARIYSRLNRVRHMLDSELEEKR